MIRPALVFAAYAAAGALSAAFAGEPVSSADRAFVAMVSQGGMFEVQAGAVGASKDIPRISRTRAPPRSTITNWSDRN